jgi:hypothetical protein
MPVLRENSIHRRISIKTDIDFVAFMQFDVGPPYTIYIILLFS